VPSADGDASHKLEYYHPVRAPHLAAITLSVAAAIFGIRIVQPALAADTYKVKLREDVVLVPPPKELRAITLGYHAAAVDYLWGKLLAEYGIHVSEKRGFDIPRYIDGILELEPDYAPLFRYVDTLLAYRPPIGTEQDSRWAREYLERGTRARPYDPKVWLQYGQFIAFIAPTFLQSDADKEIWRKDGALAIAKAVELGADPDRSITASSMLARYGEKNATIRHLRQAYNLTDDPQIQEQIRLRLDSLEAGALREELESEGRYMEKQRRETAPFLGQTPYYLMGPMRDPLRCRDELKASTPECAFSMKELRERRRKSREAQQ
jgi:hypothetical protein